MGFADLLATRTAIDATTLGIHHGVNHPSTWSIGPLSPNWPTPGEVHLWFADSDGPANPQWLSDQEIKRAEAKAFQRDTTRYLIARTFQRKILGAYLKRDPSRLLFTTEAEGKPLLMESKGLCFNMTNSGDLLLMAVTHQAAVGIDLETFRDMSESLAIAKRYFHPFESREILRLNNSLDQQHAFFRCWTRKEAYMKALGKGLHLALDSFAVEVSAVERPALLHGDMGQTSNWSLMDLSNQKDIFGALCVEGSLDFVKQWRWPNE
jgi:4'-phosphopantetheinyl transferase